MPGVNLSQSEQEEEQVEERSFFDSGFMLSMGMILLALLAFGGVRLYIGSLDKKIAAVESALSVNAGRLKGDGIDRVADFDARLGYFSANMVQFSDMQLVLQKLEKTVLPNIILKDFEYNHQDKTVTIEGVSTDFKSLAEQIMSFKNEPVFSNIEVQSIDRTEADTISFVLRASL